MGDAKLPEAVKHTVSFTNDFYMAVFPMTECQHKMIMLGTNSTSEVDYTQSELAPKSGLWWRDLRGEFYTSGIASAGWWPTPGVWTAAGFVPDYTKSPHDVGTQSYIVLNWLRIRTGRMPGAVFDLPTDARWEYACRAGTLTENYAGGNDAETFGKIAWYGGNSDRVKHEVGLKAPNPWGLYDMHGNVWEWCLDVSGVITSSEAVVDPVGPESSNRYARRVVRGGSCGTALGNNTLTGFRSHAAVYDANSDNSPYGYRVIFDAH